MRYNSIDHNGQILFYINIGYTKYNKFRKHKKKLRAYRERGKTISDVKLMMNKH